MNKKPIKIQTYWPIKLVVTVPKKESGATAPAKSCKNKNPNIVENTASQTEKQAG